ncbi:MAG: hypothetical protein ACYDGR_10795 [Candidatus Dormibacteria bacterium]
MRVQDERGSQPGLRNHLGQLARERGLSAAEVGDRVGEILGYRLDARTLRRYLNDEPIADSTMAAVAAIARAIGVGLDEALELEPGEAVEQVLRRAGVGFMPARNPEPLPAGFWRVDPAWGDLVGEFLADRDRDF